MAPVPRTRSGGHAVRFSTNGSRNPRECDDRSALHRVGLSAATVVLTAGTVVVALGLIGVQVAGAAGTTRYASPAGAGTACSSSAPCSLTTALATAADTDTVKLAAGTYVGHFTIRHTLKNLTVEPGTAGATVTLTGGGSSPAVLTVTTGASATVVGLTITGATAGSSGGGIENKSTLTVEGSTISGNHATSGAGINSTGTLTVEGSTISGNTAATEGGGIYARTGTVTVEGSTISGNSATTGGGIYITTTTPHSFTTDNSTVADNAVRGTGGGFYIYSTTGIVTLESSTISGNSAATAGGIHREAGTVILAATILAKQSAGGDCTGTGITNAGYNVADETGCGFTATTGTATDHSVVSPAIDNYLGTLGPYGGAAATVPLLSSPTPATTSFDPALDSIPLLTSLTVHASTYRPCTVTAENGVARNTGTACDAGAFELAQTPPISVTARRIYGPTADATAAAELASVYPPGQVCPGTASTRPVVVATDATYPDALSSAYLAQHLSTGTLLTPPTSLSAVTTQALRDEGITHVYVVGGPLAISTSVVSALDALPAYDCGGTARTGADLSVTRIFGQTEYATAQDIATFPGAGAVGTVDLQGAYEKTNATGGMGLYNTTAGNGSAAASGPGALRTAIVATGTGFQDAESAATLSYAGHFPLLLTTPSALSPEAATAIKVLGITQVVVMGGPFAVSDAVVTSLESLGVSVLRVGGATDTQSAIELAQMELASAGNHLGTGWAPTDGVTVARGDFYSDGLAGAVVAAHGGATGHSPEPMLLTEDPSVPGNSLLGFLAQAGASGIDHDSHRVTSLTVLGGPEAVTPSAVSSMEAALER